MSFKRENNTWECQLVLYFTKNDSGIYEVIFTIDGTAHVEELNICQRQTSRQGVFSNEYQLVERNTESKCI